MGLTDPSGAGVGALHLLQELVSAAARALCEELSALFARIVQLPGAWAPGGGPASPPAGAGATPPRPAPAGGAASGQPAEALASTPPQRDTDPGLPRAYGVGRAVLVARDPWSLFAHWEVPPVRRVETLRALGLDGEDAREILRVYEADSAAPGFRDQDLPPGIEHADIVVDHPGRSYRVEIGLRTGTGRFVALVASNTVTAAPAERSADTSVRWVALEPGGPPREVAASWSGRRVTTPHTATALAPVPIAEVTPARAAGSSEAVPPGPGASEALPLGPRASDALPLR